MSDSVRPHRWQPTRLPRHWDSPGKNTGVGCNFLLQCMKVKSESEASQSCPTPRDPIGCRYQAPPSMAFSRHEYWSGLPLPSPRKTLFDVNHSRIPYDPPPRVMGIKINKWALIKRKSFCPMKETISKMKRQHSEWEKITASEATGK